MQDQSSTFRFHSRLWVFGIGRGGKGAACWRDAGYAEMEGDLPANVKHHVTVGQVHRTTQQRRRERTSRSRRAGPEYCMVCNHTRILPMLIDCFAFTPRRFAIRASSEMAGISIRKPSKIFLCISWEDQSVVPGNQNHAEMWIKMVL